MTGQATLRIDCEDREDLVIVRVLGPVVEESLADLGSRLEALVEEGRTRLAIDLAGVSRMDSAGRGCLSALRKRIGSAGPGAMAVFAAAPAIEEAWRLIGLDRVIPVFSEEHAALSWLREQF